ncbi:MAG TPA: alpha/beta hydrolase-fold protein [Chloroflexota bacterium]|nr:alpha/beta hydrolase-fold protein [Chloroflexota bacterium]
MPAPNTSSDGPLSSRVLLEKLASHLSGESGERLTKQLRGQRVLDSLSPDAPPIVDELTVGWVLSAPGAKQPPSVVSQAGFEFRQTLTRLGATDVYATTATLPEGSAMRWIYDVDGELMGGGSLEVYRTHPDSLPRPDVPKGAVTQQPVWHSNIFPGTVRNWWLYVPAQYRPEEPAAVMVFQDGGRHYKDHIPTVFDNLIATGEMPPTIGIFIDPGIFADTTVPNRSFEYDTLSDQYTRFLLEEILPEVEKTYILRSDAASRAIGGISSGGICALTVAWQRPESFSKVLSWVGSFTNIASGPTLREGGHNYPALVRKLPRKPIRVFLQDGENDLDNAHGSWPLANQQMAKALAYAGYDYQFVYGQGFHSPLHGRAILPDSLRWLWRDWRDRA